jgi:hypothetical protein
MNGIQVYQNNTLLLTVNVSTLSDISLPTYTPYIKILTGNTGFYSVTGSTITASGTTSFTVPAAVNAITPDVYEYEVYLQKGTEAFTAINDTYTVLPSIIGT